MSRRPRQPQLSKAETLQIIEEGQTLQEQGDEEQAAACFWRVALGNTHIIRHHLRGDPDEDLQQEGLEALFRAARRHRRGVPFRTTAKAELRDMDRALERGTHPGVRLARKGWERRWHLLRWQRRHPNATLEELAAMEGISPEEARGVLAFGVASLDAPASGEDGQEMSTMLDLLEAPDADAPDDLAELMMSLRRVEDIVGSFSGQPGERYRDVLARRFGLLGHTPEPINDIGQRHGVCGSRVGQLCDSALDLIRAHLEPITPQESEMSNYTLSEEGRKRLKQNGKRMGQLSRERAQKRREAMRRVMKPAPGTCPIVDLGQHCPKSSHVKSGKYAGCCKTHYRVLRSWGMGITNLPAAANLPEAPTPTPTPPATIMGPVTVMGPVVEAAATSPTSDRRIAKQATLDPDEVAGGVLEERDALRAELIDVDRALRNREAVEGLSRAEAINKACKEAGKVPELQAEVRRLEKLVEQVSATRDKAVKKLGEVREERNNLVKALADAQEERNQIRSELNATAEALMQSPILPGNPCYESPSQWAELVVSALRGAQKKNQELLAESDCAEREIAALEEQIADLKQPPPEPSPRLRALFADAHPFSHYYKPCPYPVVDVYRVLTLFEVTDPALQHAVKKLLVAGGRGHKAASKDVEEAIVALQRWHAMREEEAAVEMAGAAK